MLPKYLKSSPIPKCLKFPNEILECEDSLSLSDASFNSVHRGFIEHILNVHTKKFDPIKVAEKLMIENFQTDEPHFEYIPRSQINYAEVEKLESAKCLMQGLKEIKEDLKLMKTPNLILKRFKVRKNEERKQIEITLKIKKNPKKIPNHIENLENTEYNPFLRKYIAKTPCDSPKNFLKLTELPNINKYSRCTTAANSFIGKRKKSVTEKIIDPLGENLRNKRIHIRSFSVIKTNKNPAKLNKKRLRTGIKIQENSVSKLEQANKLYGKTNITNNNEISKFGNKTSRKMSITSGFLEWMASKQKNNKNHTKQKVKNKYASVKNTPTGSPRMRLQNKTDTKIMHVNVKNPVNNIMS